MDLERVKAVLKKAGEPEYRLRQILDAVYRDCADSWAGVKTVPAGLRAQLEREAPLLSLKQCTLHSAQDGMAHKALLETRDKLFIESVLLKPKPAGPWSACISCQVGCAMGCRFCATGAMGLVRNLTPEEISDQVLFWRQYLRRAGGAERLGNVVYMGMGEPLHCIDEVSESLRILMDPQRFAMSARHLSVSTVGIATRLEQFAAEFPQINLAVSLHSGIDELRSKLVPANKAYPLKALAAVLQRILAATRRKIFLEYVLIGRLNDGPVHARELARFVRSVGRPDLLHVNLILLNPTSRKHQPPPAWVLKTFRDELVRLGLHVTVRKSLGAEISAACGQLVTGGNRKRPGGGGFRALS